VSSRLADAAVLSEAARLRAELGVTRTQRDLAIVERDEVRALLDDLLNYALNDAGT
jgi:hypothetical protein